MVLLRDRMGNSKIRRGNRMSILLTHSGKRIDLLNPDPALIDINDIAHAIGNICRFTGHTNMFYSVAQHSVLASELVPREWAMHALLHDATEAYISDVASPIKPHLINYAEIEHNLWQAIAERFGLDPDMPPCIKHADLRMLATEKRDLMPHDDSLWPGLEGIEPLAYGLHPFAPHLATHLFIDRYVSLTHRRKAA